jgi:16S rRNA (guanine527-N7)-methyltransferase
MIKSFISKLKSPPEDIDFFCEQCSRLYPFLCEENETSNLTRILSEDDFWIKHVADSLLLLDYKSGIASPGTFVADLGCGAGFPSLILAIAFPDISITAIDSISKKTDFVSRAGEFLKLDNLKVITGRGRELAAKEEWADKFDFITARAVSDAKKVFREVRRMLKPNGEIILYKTPEAAEKEICEVRKCSRDFKWNISKAFYLPQKKGCRCFLSGIQNPPDC